MAHRFFVDQKLLTRQTLERRHSQLRKEFHAVAEALSQAQAKWDEEDQDYSAWLEVKALGEKRSRIGFEIDALTRVSSRLGILRDKGYEHDYFVDGLVNTLQALIDAGVQLTSEEISFCCPDQQRGEIWSRLNVPPEIDRRKQ